MISAGSLEAHSTGAEVTMAKKKKGAKPEPQHAWLFPKSEEKATVNGSGKGSKNITGGLQQSIAPSAKPPASPRWYFIVMQAVADFLADYEFHETSKIFQKERELRSKVPGWERVPELIVFPGESLLLDAVNAWVLDKYGPRVHKGDTSQLDPEVQHERFP